MIPNDQHMFQALKPPAIHVEGQFLFKKTLIYSTTTCTVHHSSPTSKPSTLRAPDWGPHEQMPGSAWIKAGGGRHGHPTNRL